MVVQHCETHSADLSSVRRVVYGASPIAEDLLLRAMRVFANASFCQVYGSTESSAVATILGPADHDATNSRLRSCGKAHAGTEVSVVDGDGNAMPTGQVGEVVVRGPCVMKGYWRNQVATEMAFYPNGWLRTGDAAYFDTDGFLFIYDRVKDMIVTGAENVYPAEVENAIFGHPAVADVAVIGVPDPRARRSRQLLCRVPVRRQGNKTLLRTPVSGSPALSCRNQSTSLPGYLEL
jgi:fatty-acyl-CoA synthase